MDLVDLMDRLLDICERNPDFKHYHLDSQTIVLEDYLEIRPEKRSILEKHIRNGRILAGPWYTLPDMFLISGEAVVRNLLRGHKIAGSMGKVMKAGYSPMSYGQLSQIAQIYRGFGIDSIMFYRGMDTYGIKKSEYILEAPDGSRILGVKFPHQMTRFNFRFNVWSGTVYPDNPNPWVLFHPCNPDDFDECYTLLHTNFEKVFNTKGIVDGIQRAKDLVVGMATTDQLLLMDGFDASYPHENTSRIVKYAAKHWPHDKMIHSSFEKYVAAVKKRVKWDKLQVVKGERRTPAIDTMGTSIMQGILTSHNYFKRANHDTQVLLEKLAEPLASFAWMLGARSRAPYLDLGWKYILSNHGHDTICGASVDQIYVDAMDRLNQSRQIARHTAILSQNDIVERVTTRKNSSDDPLLFVFNTLNQPRSEVVEAYVDFPQDEKVASFSIIDFKGKEIPYQQLKKESLYGVTENGDETYRAYFMDRFHVEFPAESVPAMGYKALRLVANPKAKPLAGATLVTGKQTLENDSLKVVIQADGTLDITDKKRRKTYKGLNYFEDGGDAGTPWYYIRPAKDRILTTRGKKAKVALIEDKPLTAAFRVETSLTVPESLTRDKTERVKRQKTIAFVSTIRLTRLSKAVEIHTEVQSPVEDHRTRAMFPTGIRTDVSWAESNFDIMERPIDWKEDTSAWIDKEVGIKPQQMFMDLTDGITGLAILNRGLREFEVSRDKSRTVGITLVRGARYPKIAGGASPWADDPIPQRCQMKGTFEFDYAICPHAGDWEKGDCYAAALNYNAPLLVAQCSAHAAVENPEQTFLSIGPKPLELSAVKIAESGKSLIVRFFNPTDRRVNGRIHTAVPIKRARLVNLNEEPQQELKVTKGHTVDLPVGKKKIVTVELFLKRGAVSAAR